MNHESEIKIIDETITDRIKEYTASMLEKIPLIGDTGKMDKEAVAKVAINIRTLIERKAIIIADFREAYETLDVAEEEKDEGTK